jgi:hypothetical protein
LLKFCVASLEHLTSDSRRRILNSLKAATVEKVAARKNIATVIISEWNVVNTANAKDARIVNKIHSLLSK